MLPCLPTDGHLRTSHSSPVVLPLPWLFCLPRSRSVLCLVVAVRPRSPPLCRCLRHLLAALSPTSFSSASAALLYPSFDSAPAVSSMRAFHAFGYLHGSSLRCWSPRSCVGSRRLPCWFLCLLPFPCSISL